MKDFFSDSFKNLRFYYGRFKRCFWNRNLKLQWNRLWIRKDEFHKSLNFDLDAIRGMQRECIKNYISDLIRRRRLAHERDLDRNDRRFG